MRLVAVIALALLATSVARGEPAFTLAALDALLRESPLTHRPIEDVAELVSLLPDELRENFTLVHHSRSPFAASIGPLFPRVVLFSKDARFVATFIGDPRAPGHDVVELLTFDDVGLRFVPSVRVLPRATVRDHALGTEGCTKCHGADPRPIYDSYPLWPGFYGSVEDTFPGALPASRRELAAYRSFLGTSARQGVYAALRWVQGSRVSPYLPPERFVASRTSAPADELVYQPNTRLGMALTELNRKRIFRRLRASSRFRGEELPALAELLACEGSAPRGTERLRRALRVENAQRIARLGTIPRGSGNVHFAMQELTQLDNLARIDDLAHRLGVDASDWSMALEPGAHAYYDGMLEADGQRPSYYFTADFIFELLRDASEREPALRPYFVETSGLLALGYPFGRTIDPKKAAASCTVLRALIGPTHALNGPVQMLRSSTR